MKLLNKTVLVTGGSKGIGKAIAQRFIKEGAKVIVFDLEKPDYKVDCFQVDISKEEQIAKAFHQIKQLDILVNNAGVYFQSLVEKTTKEQLDKVTDVNFKGTYLMCRSAIPLIKKSKGNIINISSGLGIVPEPASPAYCATKAAIIMLTKCMAQEYAKEGIRVNVILPGPIDTPLLRNAFSSKNELDEYVRINPMKRIGKPEEVANVVLFLASDDASYVTGGLYSVDGGESTSSLYSK
ncbi:MAG: SDR family NAD(P)-dependent oxidoreductase [Nanoarchaeota archaeon]|nr:SDR family NAD(P)-dependent oxidoreductase [Nanoarchaeota archaeon]